MVGETTVVEAGKVIPAPAAVEVPTGRPAQPDPGDAVLLDWFLGETPERRLAWNQGWARLVVELRDGRRDR